MTNTFVDLHVIQTVPPSNINRDDTGSPKTATFGGVRRARVSSQAWKRAVREQFKTELDPNQLGERTLLVVDRIAEIVKELNPGLKDRAVELSKAAVKAAGIDVKPQKVKLSGGETTEREQTGYLLFASRPQMRALAELIVSNPDSIPSKKDAKKALTDGVSIDVALFGRMIADAPDLNVDACAQVAHALSVHSVESEFDYFTAVDDNKSDENAGAGMIGTIEFNSSTLYRYASINATELARVLGSAEAAARAVGAFTRAFITSMPTGKQNTFANRTLPDFVLLSIRDDQPVNLVGAFEQPISTTAGRVAEAAARLVKRDRDIDQAYGTHPVTEMALAVGDAASALRDHDEIERGSLDDLARQASEVVAERTRGL
ncbi:MAG: type I-E CRISPR-associated protein Cas7/Cse4/CasC [Propionibacterium sp.]|jgi:CRISPR system Cascade subunit CasC|nr:type I-E CRISPR-associated protein Cas7/Cse4/CasC [Propionibacterium sp.]